MSVQSGNSKGKIPIYHESKFQFFLAITAAAAGSLHPDTVQFIPSAGYVHSNDYGSDGESWTSWIKVQSEKHAYRLIRVLNWYETPYGDYPGRFYRSTWYDSKNKRLVTRAGYDV